MIVQKNKKLVSKLRNTWDGNPKKCKMCNKEITEEQITNNDYEYVKNGIFNNFYHLHCILKRKRG